MKTRFKFLREGMKSNSGDCTWSIDEWKHEDKIDMCNAGFHCSKKVFEAFSYVQGEILAKVEVKGKSEFAYSKKIPIFPKSRLVSEIFWERVYLVVSILWPVNAIAILISI